MCLVCGEIIRKQQKVILKDKTVGIFGNTH